MENHHQFPSSGISSTDIHSILSDVRPVTTKSEIAFHASAIGRNCLNEAYKSSFTSSFCSQPNAEGHCCGQGLPASVPGLQAPETPLQAALTWYHCPLQHRGAVQRRICLDFSYVYYTTNCPIFQPFSVLLFTQSSLSISNNGIIALIPNPSC